MNSVNLLGRLTKDPESYAPQKKDGTLVVKFTLAVQRDKENADFIRCTCFGKTAETVEDYLHKGSMICVTGRIQTGSYEKDGATVYTTDVIVDRFDFAEKREAAEEEPEEKPAKGGSRYAGRERRR